MAECIALLSVAALTALTPGHAHAQASNESDPPARTEAVSDEEFQLPCDDETHDRISGLIDMLGSPAYREREDAGAELLTIGLPAFHSLRVAYRNTEDLEARLRIEQIIHEAYFDHHLFGRNGFLGIRQRPVPASGDDQRIKEGYMGISIVDIIPDTGAARSALRKRDVIIALDGEPLPLRRLDGPDGFGELIRRRRPGTTVTLTVLHGKNERQVQATLGPRPPRYYVATVGPYRDMLNEATQRFAAWWAHHFGDTGVATDGKKP